MKIANSRADRAVSWELRGTMWMDELVRLGHEEVLYLEDADVVLLSKMSEASLFDGDSIDVAKSKFMVFDIDDPLEELSEDVRQLNTDVLKSASLVTCSTPYLYGYAKAMNPNVALIQNGLPREWFNAAHITVESDVLYCGGNSQQQSGLDRIAPRLLRIMSDHEKVTMVLGNCDTPDVLRVMESRITHHNFILPLASYISYMKELGPSIALAPVTDGDAALYKSNIKYLVYTACGIPTVLDADDCELLLSSNESRQANFESAKEDCSANFTLESSMSALSERLQ